MRNYFTLQALALGLIVTGMAIPFEKRVRHSDIQKLDLADRFEPGGQQRDYRP